MKKATPDDLQQLPNDWLHTEPPPVPAQPFEQKHAWFVDAFEEDFLHTLSPHFFEHVQKEANFLKDSFGLTPEQLLLDVGCGVGQHAYALAQLGASVVGVDRSRTLLLQAHQLNASMKDRVHFLQQDMRSMHFAQTFDAAYCLGSTWGFFDDRTQLQVAKHIHRSLKPGGLFLLHALNRDSILEEVPFRHFWQGLGCLVIEEVDFDKTHSRLLVERHLVFPQNQQIQRSISLRLYSVHELHQLLQQAGFVIRETSSTMSVPGQLVHGRDMYLLVEKK